MLAYSEVVASVKAMAEKIAKLEAANAELSAMPDKRDAAFDEERAAEDAQIKQQAQQIKQLEHENTYLRAQLHTLMDAVAAAARLL